MAPSGTPAASSPCPTCGKPADPAGKHAPFCGARCQLVDLGRWLKGDYRVPGEPLERPPSPGDDPDDAR